MGLFAQSGQPAKDGFRKKFQVALRACLRKGFSVEECFGVVWEETLDLIPLPEPDQGPLYEEMIQWAKNLSQNVGQTSSLPVHGLSPPRVSGGEMPPKPADKLSAPQHTARF